MPGFTPTESRQLDAHITNEPDVMEFICPRECENPSWHQGLEYCPETLATELTARMEEIIEIEGVYTIDAQELWEEIHEVLMEGDAQAFRLAKCAESGPREAEYLYALRQERKRRIEG